MCIRDSDLEGGREAVLAIGQKFGLTPKRAWFWKVRKSARHGVLCRGGAELPGRVATAERAAVVRVDVDLAAGTVDFTLDGAPVGRVTAAAEDGFGDAGLVPIAALYYPESKIELLECGRVCEVPAAGAAPSCSACRGMHRAHTCGRGAAAAGAAAAGADGLPPIEVPMAHCPV